MQSRRETGALTRRALLARAGGAVAALALEAPALGRARGLVRPRRLPLTLLEKVQRYASARVQPLGASGPTAISWAVVDGGGQAGASGTLQQTGAAADEHTLFEIGSVTKLFTTLLVAETIVRKRHITLDTRIGAFLPRGVRNHRLKHLTLREMSTYGAGLQREPPAPKSVAQLVRFLNGRDAFMPGLRSGVDYFYSNLEFDLLADVVARIWDSSWESLLAQLITVPLGMPDTVRTPSAAQNPRVATGYDRTGLVAPPLTLPWFLGGSKILRSTSADMLNFLRAQIEPSSAPGSLATSIPMTQRLLFTPRNSTLRFGLGWFLHTSAQGQTVLAKDGGVGGFKSFIGFSPGGSGLYLAANSNLANPDGAGLRMLGASQAPGEQG